MGFFNLIVITPQNFIDNHTVFIITKALYHKFFHEKVIFGQGFVRHRSVRGINGLPYPVLDLDRPVSVRRSLKAV